MSGLYRPVGWGFDNSARLERLGVFSATIRVGCVLINEAVLGDYVSNAESGSDVCLSKFRESPSCEKSLPCFSEEQSVLFNSFKRFVSISSSGNLSRIKDCAKRRCVSFVYSSLQYKAKSR